MMLKVSIARRGTSPDADAPAAPDASGDCGHIIRHASAAGDCTDGVGGGSAFVGGSDLDETHHDHMLRYISYFLTSVTCLLKGKTPGSICLFN
ncbi:MAG: hypothetical protein ACKPKO_48955, partial [Candidatus Fonsibacter sp.]